MAHRSSISSLFYLCSLTVCSSKLVSRFSSAFFFPRLVLLLSSSPCTLRSSYYLRLYHRSSSSLLFFHFLSSSPLIYLFEFSFPYLGLCPTILILTLKRIERYGHFVFIDRWYFCAIFDSFSKVSISFCHGDNYSLCSLALTTTRKNDQRTYNRATSYKEILDLQNAGHRINRLRMSID